MSAPPEKKDIAHYFQPRTTTIPRKRPSPEPDEDEDTIVVNTNRNPSTLSVNERLPDQDVAARASSSSRRPLAGPPTTPRLNRNLSIPIRSPVTPLSTRGLDPQSLPFPRLQNDSPHTASKWHSGSTFADLPKKSVQRQPPTQQEIADSDDDDDGLPSLATLIPSTTQLDIGRGVGSSKSDHLDTSNANRSRQLFSGVKTNSRMRKQAEAAEEERRERAAKQSFSLLMDSEEQEKASQQRMAEVKALQDRAAELHQALDRQELDQEKMRQLIQGHDEVSQEDKERLMGALARTNAASNDTVFSFFGSRGPSCTVSRNQTKLPAQMAELCSSRTIASRERLFRSGFLTELAKRGKLDDASIRWVFDAVLSEASATMRRQYIEIIAATSATWTHSNVSAEDIQSMFSAIGADAGALNSSTAIEATTNRSRTTKPHDYQHLLTTLRLMNGVCQHLDFACLTTLVSIILRLSTDESVMRQNSVCQAVEYLLEKLINIEEPTLQQHVHLRTIQELTTHLHTPQLQLLVLSHLPCSTSAAAKVRLRLAYNFLFRDRTASGSDNATHATLHEITDAMKGAYAFTKQGAKAANHSSGFYAQLQARTRILNIAISDGFRPTVFASRSEEQDFNADVDALANQIHDLCASIADSGASQMKKTEAKQLLSTLEVRLLHGTRTRKRRRAHVFDTASVPLPGKQKKTRIRDAFDVAYERDGKNFMSQYLKAPVKQSQVENDE